MKVERRSETEEGRGREEARKGKIKGGRDGGKEEGKNRRQN